jgi:uncharacterized PurR-regulated membrane protein YhhQ (DUF165 family)
MTILLFALFAATVPTANWLIGHVGACVQPGLCVVPVGLGFSAPSGVLIIGVAMVLRDMLHEAAGIRWVLIAIAVGGVLSALVAPPALVLASVAAFVLAELADLAAYTPLRHRGLWLAVLASGLIGSVVDSALFLGLAFGSLSLLAGQVIGKTWASLIGAAILAVRERLARA